jgi:hypothetical protein
LTAALSRAEGSGIGGSVFTCLIGIVADGLAANAASALPIFASQPAINCLSVAGAFTLARDRSTTWLSLLITIPTNARPFCSNMPSLYGVGRLCAGFWLAIANAIATANTKPLICFCIRSSRAEE